MKAKMARLCELCNRQAELYCDSDAAFLCFNCDTTVHSANFLVARHLRRLICSNCNSLAGRPFSGGRSPHIRRVTCLSCSPDDETDSISSSSSSALSSACISSTGTAETGFSGGKSRKFRRRREEGIFVIWCNKMGLNGNLVISRAEQAMGVCTERLGKVVPLRVCQAASFWVGMRFCPNKSVATRQNLRVLEEVSGVPSKLIVAVGLKLENLLSARRRSRLDLEEGWAECAPSDSRTCGRM